MKSEQFQRSIRREKELEAEAVKEGKGVYRLRGPGPFRLVTIDNRARQITFIDVRAHKGSNFRVDRDVKSYPEFLVVERTVSYDGKVKA